MTRSNSKVFISYGTPYDEYIGKKNWNELSLAQRKSIAEFQFAGKELDYENFIIGSGLKKLQSGGLTSLYVASFMLNERLSSSPIDSHTLLSVFANTRFFREVNGLLQGTSSETTDYTGTELERLAQTNHSPSLLDKALDMDVVGARRFIQAQLEPLHKFASVPSITNDSTSSNENSPPRRLQIPIRQGWSLFNLFLSSEVKWIRACINDFFSTHSYMATKEAWPQCLRIAGDAEKAKYSIRVDGKKPEQIALMIIRNVALDNLAYGTHHVYRGILSIMGHEYERMFLDAVKLSVDLDFETTAEANADIAEMKAVIKSAG